MRICEVYKGIKIINAIMTSSEGNKDVFYISSADDGIGDKDTVFSPTFGDIRLLKTWMNKNNLSEFR